MTTAIQPTRVAEFIKQMMLWAHGHQIKAITKFVLAIIDKQTGCRPNWPVHKAIKRPP